MNEGSARQRSGTLLFDDLSTLPLLDTDITWSVQSGPITSISSNGLATAAAVYQATSAIVQGTYRSLTDTLILTVLNSLPDNFNTYAADGIDDDWQVQCFGLNNLNAAPLQDPDSDGKNNLFEYTAGVILTNSASRFLSTIASAPGQPSQKNIVFSPRFSDRTYIVQSSTTLLGPSWTTLITTTTTDTGLQRAVTDTSATGARKFYRVEISKP